MKSAKQRLSILSLLATGAMVLAACGGAADTPVAAPTNTAAVAAPTDTAAVAGPTNTTSSTSGRA